MHRFVTEPRSTFEELFTEAAGGTVVLPAAAYPPVCEERSGDVTLSLGPTGAMIVHVTRSPCRSDDFRLRLLFETGTCVFSDAPDLQAFWRGPLASAFGITPPRAPEEAAAEPPQSRGAAPDGGGDRPAAQQSILEDMPSRGRGSGVDPTPRPGPEPSEWGQGPRRLTAACLADELARVVRGQEAALERVASATVAHLTKRHPARPGSVLLLGPTGVGKTSTVEALPAALKALGYPGASVYRLDCGELTDAIQVTRLLGAPPGYVGYAATTPLLEALGRPGCILLVDELEKADDEVVDLLLGLLDAGRLTGSAGTVVDARHVVVALTTSAGGDELERMLGRTQIDDRWAVQRACAEHLRAWGLPADLVGRIGAFALYAELELEDGAVGLAAAAVSALAREYGLTVVEVEPVVLEVVADIARAGNVAAGARALHHAAQELLAERLATLGADGPPQRVVIEAGPPLTVRPAQRQRSAGTG